MKKLIATNLLLAAALMMLPAQADAGRPQLQQERLAVGRALLEVQAADLPSILPFYTADIEYHDPIVDIHGIDQMTEFLFRLFGSSPDLVTTIEDETLVGGTYAATWTMVGQFDGVPYDAKGISIIKFRGRTARVHYQRDYYTEGDIMAGIPGLDEAILGFRTYYRCAVDPTFDCPLAGVASDAAAGGGATGGQDGLIGSENRLHSPVQLHRARMAVGRSLVEINAGDWQSLLAFYDEDYQYRDPIVAIDGFDVLLEFFARLFASSPDLVTTVEDETLQDGVYMATWTMTGQFDGIPYSAPGMSIVKFADDDLLKVDYSRDYYTEGDIMASIPGLDEAVAGFRVYYRCAVDPTFDCPLEGAAPLAGADEGPDKSNGPEAASAPRLLQNAPNPFNPATEISFVVPDGGARVVLRVYDVTGGLVRTLVDGFEPAGLRTVSWSGRDDRGQPVASGTYFYQLTAPDRSEMKSMVLLK